MTPGRRQTAKLCGPLSPGLHRCEAASLAAGRQSASFDSLTFILLISLSLQTAPSWRTDVAAPELIGRRRREPALDQIWRHGQPVRAVGGRHELPPALGTDAVALHQLPHSLLAHAQASCEQLLVHPGPAVLATDFAVDGSHVGQQRLVAVEPARPAGRCLCLPLQLKYPLGLTSSTSHIIVIGQRSFIDRIQAYLAERPAQSTPRLFLAMSRSIFSRATWLAAGRSQPAPA
jgi:hypothetical protein